MSDYVIIHFNLKHKSSWSILIYFDWLNVCFLISPFLKREWILYWVSMSYLNIESRHTHSWPRDDPIIHFSSRYESIIFSSCTKTPLVWSPRGYLRPRSWHPVQILNWKRRPFERDFDHILRWVVAFIFYLFLY